MRDYYPDYCYDCGTDFIELDTERTRKNTRITQLERENEQLVAEKIELVEKLGILEEALSGSDRLLRSVVKAIVG